MTGEYEVIELQCMGCEALEEHHKGKSEINHSLKEYLIDVGPPDEQLPMWRPNFAALKRKDGPDA